MPDVVKLVVSTTETRNELEIPVQFIENTTAPSDSLLSLLRESEVQVPNAPMITKNETGYLLHETPVFG